jgi:hypothetical protein
MPEFLRPHEFDGHDGRPGPSAGVEVVTLGLTPHRVTDRRRQGLNDDSSFTVGMPRLLAKGALLVTHAPCAAPLEGYIFIPIDRDPSA